MNSPPSWPSLYNPALEIFPIENRDPVQPQGHYLEDPHDIFRFTLYWTFVLYLPSFVVCGIYAFLNLSFPPRRLLRKGRRTRPALHAPGSGYSYKNGEDVPLRRYDGQGLGIPSQSLSRSRSQLRAPARSPAKQNERRSRLTFAFLVFMLFAAVALAGAVVGAAVIGYVLAGLFKAARYHMSTWIPFLGALMQTLVSFLALWPSVIDII